jgi:uncharacterized protein (DUF427 family)
MHPLRDPIGPGQESVWDYPRPPRLEPCARHIVIRHGGVTLVDSRRTLRMLETSHPPTYYIPPGDVAPGALVPGRRASFCEWKGRAAYYDVRAGALLAPAAAWSYPAPSPPFAALAGFVAFYVTPFDECTVDGERARPQPGGFYGGWVTSHVAGPFKGGPASAGW